MATTKELRKQRRLEEDQARKSGNRASVPAAAEQPPSPQAFSEELDFAEDGPKSLAEFLASRNRQADGNRVEVVHWDGLYIICPHPGTRRIGLTKALPCRTTPQKKIF